MEAVRSQRSQAVPKAMCEGRFELVKEVQVAPDETKVYEGLDGTTDSTVAIRLERKPSASARLQQEVDVLRSLAQPALPQGFVSVIFWGPGDPSWNCLVSEQLGKSLGQCVKDLGGDLGTQNTVLVAKQILHRVEYLHSKGIVHRDISPRSFVFGVGSKVHHLYLTEFGTSSSYWMGALPGRHMMQKTGCETVGALPFMSINAHHGLAQSRRDDLEAVGYVLVFLLGKLPWFSVQALSTAEKSRKIRELKESTSVSSLCDGLPRPIEHLLDTSRGMSFTARPDYWDLGTRFSALRKQMGLKHHQFTWLSPANVAELDPLIKPQHPVQPDDLLAKRTSGSSVVSSLGSVRAKRCAPCGGIRAS